MKPSSLTEQDYRSLEKCFIPRAWADKAGLYRVDNSEGAKILDRKVKRGVSYSGIVFPYCAPGVATPQIERLRRDQPDYEEDPTKPTGWRENRKYLIAQGCKNCLYYYRAVNPAWMRDASVPLYIVEGEKKTIALQRYFDEVEDSALVVGIPGVWGWRTRKKKLMDDIAVDVKGLLYDFDYLQLEEREVFVIYDADARENSMVELGRRRLVNTLRQRGARARWLEMPDHKQTGCKGIDDLLGAKGAAFVTDWLTDAIAKPNDEGYINVSMLTVAEVIAKSWEAIQKNNAIPYLFQRDGQAYRIEADDAGVKCLREVTASKLRVELMDAAMFVRTTKEGDVIPSDIPDKLPSDMLAIYPLPLPTINRIVRVPVFSKDGKMSTAPGYDEATRNYLDLPPDLILKPVKQTPDADDVEKCRKLLFEHLLVDFPFEGDGIADKAHAAALFLLPFVREMIHGSTPLHLVDSAGNGAGKSILVECLLYPSQCQFPPTSSMGTDEETNKSIFADLLQKSPTIFLDNINEKIASAILARYITSSVASGRILGQSKVVTVPCVPVWSATGSNVKLSNENTRRTISIRIAPQTDQPENRQDFVHPRLKQWVEKNVALFIWAAHTMVRYWLANKPEMENEPTLGSFEQWADVIGGILKACGIPGFLGNRQAFNNDSNDEREGWQCFIERWEDTPEMSTTPQPTKALLALVEAGEDSGLGVHGRDYDARVKSFGHQLRAHIGIVYKVNGRLIKIHKGARHRDLGNCYELRIVPETPKKEKPECEKF